MRKVKAKLKVKNKFKQQNHRKSIGLTPGTIVYTGDKGEQNLSIELFDYTKTEINESTSEDIAAAFDYKNSDSITWININGINHTHAIKEIGEHYGLHPLIMEDIATTQQRPKIEEYGDYIFIVFKMLYYDAENELVVEHVSLVVGDNYVITFQEADGDVFDTVRDRLRNAKGIIRTSGSDYLTYALMDAVVDNYFLIIETLGEKIETIETSLSGDVPKETVNDIQELKREALKIRRSIFPLREVVSKLEKSENSIINQRTVNYFRDLYDHTIQVIETIEIYRDMLWGLMDMYMSTVSFKMNEIMKVLTIISTIFIPLTFIAGIYGMNFKNIPELNSDNGYYILWGCMVAMFLLMVWYFRRRKWL